MNQTNDMPALEFLSARILGQAQAVAEMARALERVRAGLIRDGRPRGSFLLLGPTGVGKTAISLCACEWLFGHAEDWREHLAKFDMAEFQDAGAFERWMGTPARVSRFTEEVIRLNRLGGGVIVLDEIEKAHRDFAKLWLSMLDEGRAHDALGTELRFDWIFLVMTSNLGGAGVAKLPSSAPREMKRRRMQAAASEYFGPEGLARFDEVVGFSVLDDATQEQVCEKLAIEESERLAARLAERFGRGFGAELPIPVLPPSPEVLRFLRKEGYTEREGARRMRRVVERELGEAADELVRNEPFDPVESLVGGKVLKWVLTPARAGARCVRLELADPPEVRSAESLRYVNAFAGRRFEVEPMAA